MDLNSSSSQQQQQKTLPNLQQWDKLFDCFYYKHENKIYAFDVPCQHLHTRQIEIQNRSSDELAATKFYCYDCEMFID